MNPRRTRSVGLIAALAVVVATGSCRPRARAGAACRMPEQLACARADQALSCDKGVWTPVPCRGPRGCTHHAEADECDDTVAAEGDPCPRNPVVDYACTADGARALICKDGAFSLWRNCRGPDQCKMVDARNLHCDTTLGQAGDPCAQHGTYSCSIDHTEMLLCNGTVLTTASSCRGPDGCRVQRDAHKVDCDDSLALEGDPCDQPRRIACSFDRKAELVCESNRYAKKRECRRTDCRLDAAELFCD